MAEQGKSGYYVATIWERVLVMIFGGALALLGADYFEYPYGGLISYLRNKTLLFAGEDYQPYRTNQYQFSSQSLYDEGDGEAPRPGSVVSPPPEVRRAIKSGTLNRLPKHDALKSSEKRELDRLINDL